MKLIQTLYFPPEIDPFLSSMGWCRPEFNLMSWALSCLQLQKMHGNIEIYTNNAGAKLLVEDLNLPYTSIHLDLNTYSTPDSRLWALPKIYTYSLQKDPFIHIDGDVFLFEPLSARILTGDLVAQNIEVETEYYAQTKHILSEHLEYFPKYVHQDIISESPLYAVNAGILGGNDIDFFKHYTAEALKYVNKNTECYKLIDANRFNVFFEQHLFYAMASKFEKKISCIYDNIYTDKGYSLIGNIYDAPHKSNYIHLLGHFKKDLLTCMNMARKLQSMYPEVYEQILKLFYIRKLKVFSDSYPSINANAELQWLTPSLQSSDMYLKTVEKPVLNLDVIFSNIQSTLNRFSFPIEKDTTESVQEDYRKFTQALENWASPYKNIPSKKFNDIEARIPEMLDYLYLNIDKVDEIFIQRNSSNATIESSYNWAGFFNCSFRVGIEYYENLDLLKKSDFQNLVVLDSVLGPILYDIDTVENLLLKHLRVKSSIRSTIKHMESFFDDNVINDHYSIFTQYIESIIFKLITIGAISICLPVIGEKKPL